MRKNNHERCYLVHIKSACYLHCFNLFFYAKNKNIAISQAKKYFFKNYENTGNVTFNAEPITEKEYFMRLKKENQKISYYVDMIEREFIKDMHECLM